MNFTVSSFLAGLLYGAAGLWLIRGSRREGNLWWALIGATLCIYPYFAPNVWVEWGLGAFLCFVAYRLRA